MLLVLYNIWQGIGNSADLIITRYINIAFIPLNSRRNSQKISVHEILCTVYGMHSNLDLMHLKLCSAILVQLQWMYLSVSKVNCTLI